MTNWITLTPNDLRPYLAADQVDALRTEALAAGQTDPVAAVIADVIERMRAEIRASGANRLSQTPSTVPPELRGGAAALAIEAAQTRLPALLLTADQVRAANQARHFMERVATGDIPVTVPSDPVTVPDAGPATSSYAQVLGRRTDPLTSQSLRGL
jgi:hypothetical protein